MLWHSGLVSALLLLPLAACSYDPPTLAEVSAQSSAQSQAQSQAQLQAEILTRLETADVVYLAETHDDPADHQAQLEIIQSLDQAREIAIALEMFQRPFQPTLDRYLAGELTEAELIAQSEYETRWGFPWELYAPIMRYAKANQIPLIALNTPAEVTRKVAQTGLDSLAEADLRYIPPLAEIDTSDTDYQDWLRQFLEGHGGPHGGLSFENFFAAQVLWDETMAEGVADYAAAHPDQQVIVLAGEGHIIFDYGIPSRVARRLGADLTQYSVLLHPPDATLTETDDHIADFFWTSAPPAKPE
ncbi:ChaN family lipoprotein [Romeria aff. gracilis LEGE 07310]|uniref:ChaN family lipoprotein n=2 Tax=Vasconcelosia TaxID=3366328 RepID=A0A8J7ALR8_9CYAN|nr:ChaN family lipoprotein [Romeria aff. gracilis LEGE 07310]